jgi:hypothetical protein
MTAYHHCHTGALNHLGGALYCFPVEANMEYELIREIFNPCAGEAHPQVLVTEVATDHLDSYVQQFLSGKESRYTKSVTDSGAMIYEIEEDGQKQKLTFTPYE